MTKSARQIYDMPMDQYHSGPGIGSNNLKTILRSPAHYIAAKEEPQETDVGPLSFGSAVHAALEGDHELNATVAVVPESIDRRTKAGKAAWAAFLEDSEGRAIVTAEEMQRVRGMVEAVRAHPGASSLLTGGLAEKSVFWEDEETGELCKVRPDYWRRDLGIVVDYKTCIDARKEAAARRIYQYDYHLSAAMYLDGVEAERFVWLFIEKTPPFGIGCYVASAACLEAGYKRFREALNCYHECRISDQWPAYPAHFEDIDLPYWAK